MNTATVRLFNIVSERKGQTHPLHDFVTRAGLGLRFEQAQPVREPWMNDVTWKEAQALNHWMVTVYRSDIEKSDTRLTIHMQSGTYRVWKEGAHAAAPAALRDAVEDMKSVVIAGSTAEHREFVETWSAAEPPCTEEVMETLIHDARNVEDNLTKKEFRKRFDGQPAEVCDSAWRECVKCRRQLRKLLKQSEYHTLLAWSYSGDRL